MKAVELLESRRHQWQELEQLCLQLESRGGKRLTAESISRFATFYRAACADLALADAYQLPPNTVEYLHQLVGRAHNQLYRSRGSHVSEWAHTLLYVVPRRLYRDRYLRVAFLLFWGSFLGAMYLGYASPDFAERIVGREELMQMEEMHSHSVEGRDPGTGSLMVGFYIQHNTGIGLNCFAFGLLLGVGGLIITASNAMILGTVFGYMITSPSNENFFQFVTAHGPFELNAIVVSAAAGMRLGFAIVDTKGLTRAASVRRAAHEALPVMWLAIILFFLAALIEGFLSPSAAPYWIKAVVAGVSSGLLLFYFAVLGRPDEPSPTTRPNAYRDSGTPFR